MCAAKTFPEERPDPETRRPGGPGQFAVVVPPEREDSEDSLAEQRYGRPRRHFGLAASFIALVIVPALAGAVYLYAVAADQYASTVGLSVKAEQPSAQAALLGTLATLAPPAGGDADILYEYIGSQSLVETVEDRIGLADLWRRPEGDPLFVYRGDSIEDLTRYWGRMVRADYDTTTRLMKVEARAFAPEDAQAILVAIREASAALVNQISDIARDDSVRYARADLALAETRLETARAALEAFRARTRIADPSADISGQMGILTSHQAELAEAEIALDILRENTRADDPRITAAEQRIRIITARIEAERGRLGAAGAPDFATVLSEYERLVADRALAETAYAAATTAYFAAEAEARRQSRYLVSFIEPTLAQSAAYPLRAALLATLAGFLLLIWSVGALVYYSVRDRR